MVKIKRKNSESDRRLSTVLVNWLISCGVFFYPTLCAMALFPSWCRNISDTPNTVLELLQQHFLGNLSTSFPLTICVSALGISYFVVYAMKVREKRTATILTVFATGAVLYAVVSFTYFCRM